MGLPIHRHGSVLLNGIKRHLSSISSKTSKRRILGIETSCDETGAAVIDEDGQLLGEGLQSQKRIHVKNGGVIPPLAMHLHQEAIHWVVQSAMTQARVSYEDLEAVATTTRPGLALSLGVGLDFSKDLLARYRHLQFIPVHHMEAHALTARMIDSSVLFPFLVLLVSGGHCILAVARDVGSFVVLGETIDSAPGETFDKIARRLRLHDHLQCQDMSGGQSIELMAIEGDRHMLDGRHLFRNKCKDCNFTFMGLKQAINRFIEQEEKLQGYPEFLQNLPDICASVQHQVTRHMITRILRGMEYCRMAGLIPTNSQTMVVSGGVASNLYIRRALEKLCDFKDYRLVCPPPHLCTDNGIMIAWAGMEHLKRGSGIAIDPQNIRYEPREPLGTDISAAVREAKVDIKRFKFWTDG